MVTVSELLVLKNGLKKESGLQQKEVTHNDLKNIIVNPDDGLSEFFNKVCKNTDLSTFTSDKRDLLDEVIEFVEKHRLNLVSDAKKITDCCKCNLLSIDQDNGKNIDWTELKKLVDKTDFDEGALSKSDLETNAAKQYYDKNKDQIEVLYYVNNKAKQKEWTRLHVKNLVKFVLSSDDNEFKKGIAIIKFLAIVFEKIDNKSQALASRAKSEFLKDAEHNIFELLEELTSEPVEFANGLCVFTFLIKYEPKEDFYHNYVNKLAEEDLEKITELYERMGVCFLKSVGSEPDWVTLILEMIDCNSGSGNLVAGWIDEFSA